MDQSDVKDFAKKQGLGAAMGAAYGAASGTPFVPRHHNPHVPGLAIQASSAMGAAARNGGGFNGAVAAGTAVVSGKVAAVCAASVAAAPVVVGVAAIYGLYRLWKRS